jgi:co-chaperonin GroES (HSP10)
MIKPLRNYLLLEQVMEEKNISGFIISENADTIESPKAKVLAIGPEVKDVKVDQLVIFKTHLFDRFHKDLNDKKGVFIGTEDAITAIYD